MPLTPNKKDKRRRLTKLRSICQHDVTNSETCEYRSSGAHHQMTHHPGSHHRLIVRPRSARQTAGHSWNKGRLCAGQFRAAEGQPLWAARGSCSDSRQPVFQPRPGERREGPPRLASPPGPSSCCCCVHRAGRSERVSRWSGEAGGSTAFHSIIENPITPEQSSLIDNDVLEASYTSYQ